MYQCLNPVMKTLVSLFGCVANHFHDSNALLEKSIMNFFETGKQSLHESQYFPEQAAYKLVSAQRGKAIKPVNTAETREQLIRLF